MVLITSFKFPRTQHDTHILNYAPNYSKIDARLSQTNMVTADFKQNQDGDNSNAKLKASKQSTNLRVSSLCIYTWL